MAKYKCTEADVSFADIRCGFEVEFSIENLEEGYNAANQMSEHFKKVHGKCYGKCKVEVDMRNGD